MKFIRSFAARAACLLFVLMPVSAVFADLNTQIIFMDGAGFGFNDPVLGEDRKAAFRYAVDVWASTLDGPITVRIEAGWQNLGGSANSAILGAAAPMFFGSNNTTSFAGPLANQLANADIAPRVSELAATFNADVDNSTVLGPTDFYYGLDEDSGSNIDFVRVALHELAHGFGFTDTINSDSGAFIIDGKPDTFSLNLVEGSMPVSSMSNEERLSALTSENLFFNGMNAASAHGSNPPIHAPSTFEPGSSVAHFRLGAFSPRELMEPVLVGPSLNPGLTEETMADIGWPNTDLGQPEVRLGNASSSSLNEGETVTFDIILSTPPSDNASVQLKTSGDAQLGADFSITPSGPFSFNSSQSVMTVTVEALGDGANELTETAEIAITGPIGAVFPEGNEPTSISFSILNVVPTPTPSAFSGNGFLLSSEP